MAKVSPDPGPGLRSPEPAGGSGPAPAGAGGPAPPAAYREDLARIHDAGYGDLARDAAALLIDELARGAHRGGTVVDLGCGSGVLAARVCEAGYRVLGIDVSDAMIALARERAPKAEFRAGSFVSADLPRCVAVAAIGEVLSYGFDPSNDDRARAALFRRVHDALVPGGVFLFDVAGREQAKPGRYRSYTQGADWAVLVETDVDPAAGLLTREITTYRLVGGRYRRDVELHRLVLLDTEEMLAALRAVGFEARTIAGYGAASLPPGLVAFACRKGGGA